MTKANKDLILGVVGALLFAVLGMICLFRGQDTAGGWLIFGAMAGGTLAYLRNV